MKSFLKLTTAVAVCVVAANLGLSQASAAVITYDYTATDGTGTVTGTVGYEDTAVDTLPGDPNNGDYPGSSFLTGTVSGGVQDGGVFNLTAILTLIDDNVSGRDRFLVLGSSGQTFFQLRDTTQTVFINDSLPSNLLLSAFDFTQLTLGNPDIGLSGTTQLVYQITAVTLQVAQPPQPPQQPTNVSEPGTIAIFGLGLAGLGYMRRKRAA